MTTSHCIRTALAILILAYVAQALPEGHKIIIDTGPFTTPDDVTADVGWQIPAPGQIAKGAEYQTKIGIPHFDWTQPYDYAHGVIYQRIEVISRPGRRPFAANQQIQQRGSNGDHWWRKSGWIRVTDPGTYTTSHNVQSMRDARGLLRTMADPPPLCEAFAVQEAGGNPNSRWDQADIFPMTIAITEVVVAAGYTFAGWPAVDESIAPVTVVGGTGGLDPASACQQGRLPWSWACLKAALLPSIGAQAP